MKRWDVRFLLGISVLAYAAWAQDKGDANTIPKVETRGSPVEIIGTKKPSFTSFTMTEPSRLVIDVSEAVFSGVPEQIPGGGTVSWIKTASYGSDASAIARVLIGFSKEVETDLTSVGNKLVVRILDGAPAEVARADKAAATPKVKDAEPPPQLGLANPPSGDAAAEETLARKKLQEKAKEEAAKAEQERIAQAKAEKEAAKRAELAREEARKEEAEKKRLAEEERKRKAEEERLAEQQRRAEAEEAKRQAAVEQKRKAEEERLAREQAKAEAENAKRAAAAEQKQKVEEERLARAKEAAEAAEANRQAAAKATEEKQQAAAEAAEARKQAAAEAAETKKQAAAKAVEAKRQAAEQAAEAKRQAVAERKRKAEEERLARQKAREDAAEAKRQAAAAKREAKLAASPSRRATMTFVGFERGAGNSRVYVRTTGPVRYSVQQDGDKKVVLELENTRIALRNNRRPLDTSFFDSAVAMVAPNPDRNRAVRVEIKLKETVPFQAKQDGNEVSVEFSRTAK